MMMVFHSSAKRLPFLIGAALFLSPLMLPKGEALMLLAGGIVVALS